MNFWDTVMEKWNGFRRSAGPFWEKTKNASGKVWKVLSSIWVTLVAMKKVFIGAPVAVAAMMLAINNQAKLPEVVGLNLQNNGAFSIQIAREIAVLGPLAVTALCLLLVFCSRRTLTPWLVSVFSLALPVLILVINTFPG